MARFLPSNPRARAAVGWGAFVLGLVLFTQVVLPGPQGIPGRGTPWATVFYGAVNGLVISLSTAGIVLVYRTLRIVNFAQTALGVAGSFFTFGLVHFTGVPFPIAMVLGMALSTACGVLVGVSLLRFFSSSRLVLTVISIIGAQLVATLALNVYRLPFFPDFEDISPVEQAGAYSLRPDLPFPGWSFTIGGQPGGFGFAEVFAIELTLVALVVLAFFFRYTRSGVAVRALAENPERASLLGIGVGGLSIVVWGMSGLLSGLSTALTGMLDTPARAGGFAPNVLITALVAAAVAKWEKLPTAIAATISIGIVSSSFTWSFPEDDGLVFVALFLLLAASLLLSQRRRGRSERGEVSWSAAEEQRAIPNELAVLPIIRRARWAIYAVGLAVLVLAPWMFSTGVVNTLGVIALASIITMSLVVLTGWAGQVSLGQWAFAAVGAVVGGALTATIGLPFWIAVPIAAAVTGGVAVIIGIPALRIPGLFLLPLTFAFAIAVQAAFFNDRYFGWLLPDEAIERPSLFFLDFRDETSMYFLCVACLLLSIFVIGNLRRSRTGRILIALRENDANVQSFGVPVVRTKLIAFATSGALAGFAGAVFVHQQQGLSEESFVAFRSVQAFIQAVFGGVGSIAGSLLGTAFFRFIEYFGVSGLWGVFASNGGPVILIFLAPAGLIGLVNGVRNSLLRVIAQRRQIVVPSLFADVDPEALERRLIPLSEPVDSAGLAALPLEARFELPSELYRGRRGLDDTRVDRDAEALGGAVARIAEAEEVGS
jgi:branched-chain amino acid transport system permease protein